MDFAALLAVVVVDEDLVVDWEGEGVGTMVLVVLVMLLVVVAPATATLTCASLFLISDYLLVYLVVPPFQGRQAYKRGKENPTSRLRSLEIQPVQSSQAYLDYLCREYRGSPQNDVVSRHSYSPSYLEFLSVSGRSYVVLLTSNPNRLLSNSCLGICVKPAATS